MGKETGMRTLIFKKALFNLIKTINMLKFGFDFQVTIRLD